MNAKKAKQLRRTARELSPPGEAAKYLVAVPNIITKRTAHKVSAANANESLRGRYRKLKKEAP